MITTKELKKLRKNLKKETGFKTSLSRGRIGKPRVRLPKPIPRRPPKRRPSKRRPSKRIRRPPRRPMPGRPVPRRPVPGRPVPGRPVPGRPVPRRPVPGRPVPGVPGRPIPLKPIPRVKKRRIRKRIKKIKPQSYEVYARPLKAIKKGKKPKLIKVSKVPLTKKGAKDLRNFITDQSLSRTALIRPISGKPSIKPKLKVPKGYSRRTSHKFRRWKQRKGKRIPLKKGKVIELGRHLLDTRPEKKGITLKRRIAQLSKPRRPLKRRPSPKRKTIKRKKSFKINRGIFG